MYWAIFNLPQNFNDNILFCDIKWFYQNSLHPKFISHQYIGENSVSNQANFLRSNIIFPKMLQYITPNIRFFGFWMQNHRNLQLFLNNSRIYKPLVIFRACWIGQYRHIFSSKGIFTFLYAIFYFNIPKLWHIWLR